VHRIVTLTLWCCIAFTPATRAQAQRSASPVPLMRQIYVQDQRDRGVVLSDDGGDLPPGGAQMPSTFVGDKLTPNDIKRREQVRALLAAGQVITAQDFHDAAFIFQHGQSADDYLLAHILAVEAVVKGDDSSKWISAATLDRYLQSIGQKQVFGTQYGVTQEPYNESLMPDTLRHSFCVPDLAQQKLNLEQFKLGKYPEKIVPLGCVR
jgi:hypothetical protein